MLAAERADESGGRRLRIAHGEELGAELGAGASVAVAGVCLTVVESTATEASFDVSPETESRTNVGELEEGDEVNLEPPLRVGDALGGHLVQGHVDAVVEVLEVSDEGEHRRVTVELPDDLRPYVVEKGSIALDGVSLTVASSGQEDFDVALVPETLGRTTLGALERGDRLNLEVDVLGKYVRQALVASGRIEG